MSQTDDSIGGGTPPGAGTGGGVAEGGAGTTAAAAGKPAEPRLPRTLSGQVLDTGGRPLAGARLLFFQEDGTSADTRSDGEGWFVFDLGDTSAWPEGRYTLRVLATDSTLVESERLSLHGSGSPAPMEMRVHRVEEISQGKGWAFFAGLCLALLALSHAYLDLHGIHFDAMESSQARDALDGADLPAQEDDADGLLAMAEEQSFLWTSQQGLLLEVFSWALFATLLRLIFNSGFYLYKNTFLATAIPHHLALIATIPVVAVIIAMVLTLVKLEVTFAETAVALDMSNPMISVLVACLIGLAPWKAWEFVRRMSDRLFDALAGLFKKT